MIWIGAAKNLARALKNTLLNPRSTNELKSLIDLPQMGLWDWNGISLRIPSCILMLSLLYILSRFKDLYHELSSFILLLFFFYCSLFIHSFVHLFIYPEIDSKEQQNIITFFPTVKIQPTGMINMGKYFTYKCVLKIHMWLTAKDRFCSYNVHCILHEITAHN